MKEQGKSTLAQKIAERCSGENVLLKHFSTPLKNAVECCFDIAPETPKQRMIEALGITVRQAYQKFGSAMRAAFGDDVFVRLMHTDCNVDQEFFENDTMVIIIDDVRFENEAQWILDQGGHIVHIQRTAECKDMHESERFAWQFRHTGMAVSARARILYVDNTGTVEDLDKAAGTIVDALEKRPLDWNPPVIETSSPTRYSDEIKLKEVDEELIESPMHKPGPYELDIINRHVEPLYLLVKSMTWWPDLGIESMLTTRECGLLHNHMRHNLRMPNIRDIELGFIPAFQQKTPQERVLAAFEECIKRQNANAVAG